MHSNIVTLFEYGDRCIVFRLTFSVSGVDMSKLEMDIRLNFNGAIK